jgi:hypothetical protein
MLYSLLEQGGRKSSKREESKLLLKGVKKEEGGGSNFLKYMRGQRRQKGCIITGAFLS